RISSAPPTSSSSAIAGATAGASGTPMASNDETVPGIVKSNTFCAPCIANTPPTTRRRNSVPSEASEASGAGAAVSVVMELLVRSGRGRIRRLVTVGMPRQAFKVICCPVMVSFEHSPIPAIPYRLDGPFARVDVVELADLRESQRDRPGFWAPQRPRVDLLIHVERGSLAHMVDFVTLPLGPGSMLWVHAGQVQRWGDLDGVAGTA